ncbi:MAG TPA: hypothetical protein VFL83_00755 [Anaeromyxobacter sp.]|nr:hypothetical protein [Anaeromyxobacter sp.]
MTIKSDMGDEKTLSVVPETSVMVDGREAQTAELQEGQPVRASFGEVEGKDVAVEIRAGADASGSSGSGSTGSGTPAGETTSPGMGRPEPTTGTDRDRQTPDGPSQAERQR